MDDLKVKVLILAAVPRDEAYLEVQDEYDEIKQAVRIGPQGDLMEIIYKGDVKRNKLDDLLDEHNPHIVHFSGHGKDKEIYFVDKQGNAAPVEIETMEALLRGYKQNIQVVILNACYTDAQAEAIAQIVGCAIGIDRVITDSTAKMFATSFYKKIAAGYSVQKAFDLSLLHLELVGERNEAKLFRLYHGANVDPGQINLVRLLYKGREFLSNPNIWSHYVTLIEFGTNINHAFQTLYILNLHGLNVKLELIRKDSSLFNVDQFCNDWGFYTRKYAEFWSKLCIIKMADIDKALKELQKIDNRTIRQASEENQNFRKIIVQRLSDYSNLHDAVSNLSQADDLISVLTQNSSKEFIYFSTQIFRLSEGAKSLILASDSFLENLVRPLYLG